MLSARGESSIFTIIKINDLTSKVATLIFPCPSAPSAHSNGYVCLSVWCGRALVPAPAAMSGRQYNMYNAQTAQGWKERILKENLHNAPSLRVFADLEADDDNQSVSSIGSRATGVTRASVASSKASMASTAALNRVRKTHSPA